MLLALAAGLVIRLVLAFTQGEIADTPNYHRVAAVLKAGGVLYVDTTGLFPYPPVWNHVEVAALTLAESTPIPFVVWVKLPSILADLGIAALLALLAPAGRRALYAAAYALNPVPILISSVHGQFDSLPLLCCLGAVYFLQERESPPLAALALTLGIALKAFPILLVPVFLLSVAGRKRLQFLATALLPAALILLPNLVATPRAVVHELVAYSGAPDHGWLAIARIFKVLESGARIDPETVATLLLVAKVLFLVAYATVLVYWARRPGRRSSLGLGIAFVFMLFCSLYGAISSQMLLWALPFLLLVVLPEGVLDSAAATASLAGFYAAMYPPLLYLGPPAGRAQLTRILLWLGGTTVWWLFTLGWTIRTSRRLVGDRSPSPGAPAPELA